MAAYLLAVCEVTNPNENFKKYAAGSAARQRKSLREMSLRAKFWLSVNSPI